jgi:glucose-6-phosphate 1-dehydrogenase
MKTKLVIFGLTGDLSTRKLLPALEHIIGSGDYDDLSVIGVSRRNVDVAELLQGSLGNTDLVNKFRVVSMDLAKAEDYVCLRQEINLADDEQALIYLSVPPSAAVDIVDFLGQAGVNGSNVKLLFEKPFGFDLESAKEYLERTAKYFEEYQIYRIDHYAAKDLAQDIIATRRAEAEHETWNNQSITSIEVIASEKIGVEDRATFYEETGALKDFIQGHLLQVLALILMDIPADFDDEKLSSYRLRALEAIVPADPALAIRAQYAGYQEAVGNPGSLTETFASLGLKSNDERWVGVDLRVTTGKALAAKRSYTVVRFNDGSDHVLKENPDTAKMDAYERVLIEAIAGHKTIFTTGEEVLRAWEIVTPVLADWEFDDAPLKQYEPGTSVDAL